MTPKSCRRARPKIVKVDPIFLALFCKSCTPWRQALFGKSCTLPRTQGPPYVKCGDSRVENSRPPAEFRTRIRPNSRIRRIRSISAEFGVTFRYITSFVARSRLLPSRRVPPPALPRAQTAPAAPAPTLPCPDPPVTPALRRLSHTRKARARSSRSTPSRSPIDHHLLVLLLCRGVLIAVVAVVPEARGLGGEGGAEYRCDYIM